MNFFQPTNREELASALASLSGGSIVAGCTDFLAQRNGKVWHADTILSLTEMQELKALLFPETPPAKAEKPMEVKNAPQEVLGVETEALEDEEKATQPPLPKMVFAEDVARAEKAAATAPATPKAEPEEPTKPFRFFGVGDDENAPAAPTLSLIHI